LSYRRRSSHSRVLQDFLEGTCSQESLCRDVIRVRQAPRQRPRRTDLAPPRPPMSGRFFLVPVPKLYATLRRARISSGLPMRSGWLARMCLSNSTMWLKSSQQTEHEGFWTCSIPNWLEARLSGMAGLLLARDAAPNVGHFNNSRARRNEIENFDTFDHVPWRTPLCPVRLTARCCALRRDGQAASALCRCRLPCLPAPCRSAGCRV
jgi:hypothetical protein